MNIVGREIQTRARPSTQGPLAAWAELPADIRRRLRDEGVREPADWLALPLSRRAGIFGIPPSLRRRLDQLARGKS